MSERYLANENFPAEIVRHLRRRGDDVFYAAEQMAGASDIELLRKALADDRIVLTFDRDFGELVFRHRQPAASGVVLFRLRQPPPDATLGFLRAFLDSNPSLRGMFTVSRPVPSDSAFIISGARSSEFGFEFSSSAEVFDEHQVAAGLICSRVKDRSAVG